MPLELPEGDPTRLEKSPLEVVVAQVRYENAPQVAAGEVALAVHGALGGESGPYPNVGQSESGTVNFVVGPGQPPKAEATSGPPSWQFTSADGAWTVSLATEFVALETTNYGTWSDDFRARLADVLDAVATNVQPVINSRVGVRYIDRIAELEIETPADWEPYVIPELLGPILHPTLGPGVRQSQGQLVIELEENVACTLRHGLIPDGKRVDYLMDFDVFRQAGRPFDADEVKTIADRLNKYSLSLFQACVTPALIERLR